MISVKNKFLILFSLVLIGCFQTACVKQVIEASVTEINSPTNQDLNDILFISDSVGFICGGTKYSKGIVLKTTDAGTNWILDTLTVPKALYSIVSDHNKLFTTGNEGYFYSSDNAAQSWTQPGFPYWQRFNQITFNDAGECFIAVGDGFDRGEILFSNNDGAGWLRIDTFNRTIKTIVFHHGVGFAGAYGIIYKSTDNGRTWLPTYTSGDLFSKIAFTSDQIGYAIGYFGVILKTTDGGNTWKKILNENFSFNEKSNFRDAVFLSDETAYVVGDKGYVIQTNDGGKKWNRIEKFTDTDIYTIEIVGNKLILAGAEGKIFTLDL